MWDGAPYTILMLEEFVMLRQTVKLELNLPIEERISRIQSVDDGPQVGA